MTRSVRQVTAAVTATVWLVHASGAIAAPIPLGAATPQAVVERMVKATKTKNIGEIVACLEPESRHEMTLGLLVGATMMVAFMGIGSEKCKTNPNCNANKAKAALSAVLKKHKLPDLLDDKAKLPDVKDANALFKDVDEPALAADLFKVLEATGEAKKKEGGSSEIPDLKDVKDFTITGDTATAKAGAETLDFVKLGDRWFFRPPKKDAK